MKILRMLFVVLGIAASASAQSVDDAALEKIQVTSGRSSAWAQFNQPAVHIWLPRVENSAYAGFEFAAPAVVDSKGNPVELAVQPGVYEHESAKNEIRILAKAEPARVNGKVKVRYPVRIRPAMEGEAEDKLTEPAFKVDLPKAFVEEWKQVEITYDLPVAETLPESQKGESQPVPERVADTPGGNVTVVVRK